MEETVGLYEVKGRRMANYGVKTYTPEQIKEQWRESMRVAKNLVVQWKDFAFSTTGR